MSGVLEMFEEFCPLNDKDAQITLTGDFKDWTWFKIYVFTKRKVDLQKELQSLNSLLSKHDKNYEEFSASNIVFYPKDLLVLFQENKKVSQKIVVQFLSKFLG